MLPMKSFFLTEDHIALAQRMNVRYEDGIEFGAPAIDPKRPYGNGDVICDIAEILGIKQEGFCGDDEEFSERQWKELEALHRQMETALQVILTAKSFEPGMYEAQKYIDDWRKVR